MLHEHTSIESENNTPTPVEQNFTRIKGIGDSIEKRLHAAGILTYSQLAMMTPQELAAIFSDMPGLSAERIAEKDWIDQARQLAIELGENGEELEMTNGETRQHYAVFTVELLLDEENAVRRTRVIHVQNQKESSWAGWEEARLIQFFNESAALNIDEIERAASSERVSHVSNEPSHSPSAEHEPQSPDLAKSGELRLSEMPIRAVKRDHQFHLPLVLDMTNVLMPQNTPLFYSTTVYTKKLGIGSREIVGNDQGTLMLADKAVINIPVLALPQGQYRIEAFVTLSVSKESADPYSELYAMVEGAILVH